ncbi:aquaporin [Cellulomonas sp. URHD0024]|uniref:aquaporin n=1 Tax=Cellulomonas sp. URHD0024 TaxID=1302620 RepID=UPI000425C748|nr:aquaporin [Cellulomonas sp. URHD0024]
MSQDNADKATALPEPEPDAPQDATTAPAAATDAEIPAEPAVEAPTETPGAQAPAADPTTETYEEEAYDAYYVPAGTVVSTGPGLVARLGAELFGTFFLVAAGLGVALYAAINNSGALGIALAFGVAVLAGAAAVGHVSGGHFNPAVTLGAAIGGRTAWRDVLPYWLAQLVGGAVAAAVVFITIPKTLPELLQKTDARGFFSSVANGFGTHSPLYSTVQTATQGQQSSEFGLTTALIVEIIVTAVFVGVILGVTDRRANKAYAPFAIGLALTVLILFAMPVTNASLNPARSTAAVIFSDGWALKQLWVFWVAPLFGAALAGLVYRAFAAEPPEDNLLEEDDEFVTTEDTLVVTER